MNPLLNTVDAPVNTVMVSGSNAVTAGGDTAGWVSGDTSGLAASGTVAVIFDLGPLWRRVNLCSVVVQSVTPSTGLSAVSVFGSDTAAIDFTRRCKDALSAGFAYLYASIPTGQAQEAFVKPKGRFLCIQASNADASNAQGATAHVTVTSYTS